ncbi:unnamed protein product, partial [Staurois parvus]
MTVYIVSTDHCFSVTGSHKVSVCSRQSNAISQSCYNSL